MEGTPPMSSYEDETGVKLIIIISSIIVTLLNYVIPSIVTLSNCVIPICDVVMLCNTYTYH